MPKINREEYEVLKELNDKWKWIARDKDRGLYAFTEKPVRKYAPSPYWDTETEKPYSALELIDETHLFHFIQWEDEEPYNIAELIREYEKHEFVKINHEGQERLNKLFGNESEEKEMKDIEWLKSAIQQNIDFYNDNDEEWQMAKVRAYAKSLDLINQLDEPETLSQGYSQQAYRNGFKEGERQMAEYFESITEEPNYGQVQKYLSERGFKVVEKEPETVADVITDFYKSIERMEKVLSMEVKELEE